MVLKQQSVFHLLFRCFLILTLSFSGLVRAELQSLFADTSVNEPLFVPVEKAFKLNGHISDGLLHLNFEVLPGHYLYKERFSFSASSSTTLSEAVFPTGTNKYDENFEKNMEVFNQNILITLPIQSSEPAPEIEVRFQGCAEAGLCYPPHTVHLVLINPDVIASSGNTLENAPVTENFLLGLLLFLLAGLGLTFTPCVLPMIPILSSILVGAANQNQSRSRTLTLTIAYVIGMSVTFAIAGTLMGLFGATLNLQAKLQSPWLIYPFAGMFVLLSLSMFGVYELQFPQALRDKLGGSEQKGGSVTNAAIMGILSALVVSPCVSAPLAGALIYISTTGNALQGGLSLFAMGIGMGTPLLLIGLGGKHFLPKAGGWMDNVKTFFGFMLLGVAVWMLDRVIEPQLTMVLWGALSIGAAVRLGTLDFNKKSGWPVVAQSFGLMLLIYGGALLIGAAKGNINPLQPLLSSHTTPSQSANRFTKVKTISELNAQLEKAKGQYTLIDVYADWCASCKTMERAVFPAPEVIDITQNWHLIKFDITENSQAHQQWLNSHQLFGPPALLFFNKQGQELTNLQISGEVTAAQLSQKLQLAMQNP